ncbi:MAG: hypothetical protein E6Q58_03165 [Niabella sp.]|nr:MAG: hypothetical protein E6Q58_03165 [Niabella sp.]
MLDLNQIKSFNEQLNNEIKNAKSIVCIMDSRLDFDALCSSILVKKYIQNNFDKDCKIVYLKEISSSFKNSLKKIGDDYLQINEKIDPLTLDFENTDLFIVVDCGNAYKLSNGEGFSFPENRRAKIVNIDHHVEVNARYGDLNLVMWAPSTCSLLYEIFKINNYLDDTSVQKYLLLGILADSGYLTFDKADYTDVATVADLLKRANLRIFDILRISQNPISVEELKVKSLILKNLQVFENRIAYSYLENDELISERLDPYMSLSFTSIEEFRNIEGVKVNFFVRYDEKQEAYTLSVRSYDENVDVNKICMKYFNGGGHRLSAGGLIREHLPIKMVINMVLEVFKKEVL